MNFSLLHRSWKGDFSLIKQKLESSERLCELCVFQSAWVSQNYLGKMYTSENIFSGFPLFPHTDSLEKSSRGKDLFQVVLPPITHAWCLHAHFDWDAWARIWRNGSCFTNNLIMFHSLLNDTDYGDRAEFPLGGQNHQNTYFKFWQEKSHRYPMNVGYLATFKSKIKCHPKVFFR